MDFIIRGWSKYEVFIIGSGQAPSVKEIAKVINEISNNLHVEWGAVPFGESESYYVKVDTTKARI